MKLWQGRFKTEIDPKTNDFNSSISFDYRMYEVDILGSIAHAKMLGDSEIINKNEALLIQKELQTISQEIKEGKLIIDSTAEDIHTFIESELTKRIGETGKRLHTARSRNDQVALDIRMILKQENIIIRKQLINLINTLTLKAKEHTNSIMPGYTHLQRAQPITFGHHLMAYCEMLLRDLQRFEEIYERINVMPLGSGALAGTTYPINRDQVAKDLNFSKISQNSLDAVSDRDFCIETTFAITLVMTHLSRFCEELIMWCSWEFQFIELDDAFATGSSMMPQKKNPDIAELIRGKTGRSIGDLVTLLTMMKGLPLAYNKDLQEDKEAVFDAVDTLKLCLTPLLPMIETMKVNTQTMKQAAVNGFINATDCADYLVKVKAVPFREAYKITGELIAYCIEHNQTLESISLEEYQSISTYFDDNIFKTIAIEKCVEDRNVVGGPSPQKVIDQINRVLKIIKDKELKLLDKEVS